MDELQIFRSEEFGSVRTTEIGGKTYFLATDVSNALGYSNPRDAIARHCRGVVKHDAPHPQNPSKTMEMSFIPEGDIYRLVIKSQLPSAERFESWIFDEVLPEIRQRGAYLTDAKAADIVTNPTSLIDLLQQAADQLKKKDIRIAEMRPKEVFADAVSASDTSILVRDLAKLIKQNGVDIGEKRLYKWLRNNGYIVKKGTTPTQRAMELGLFEVIERTTQRADNPPIVCTTTKVTGKGQQYFINKFLGAY
jgi:anti-repressor protein